jgi:hypothetical protein
MPSVIAIPPRLLATARQCCKGFGPGHLAPRDNGGNMPLVILKASSPHHPLRPGSLGSVILAVLLLWGLAMIVPDLRRVVAPIASIGFYADSDGLIYDDDGPFAEKQQSPSWRAGIRRGDQIDLEIMRCRAEAIAECGGVLAVLGGYEYFLPGTEVSIRLVPGSASGLTHVTLAAEPLHTNWVFRGVILLDVLAGIAVLLAAAWLVWTRPGPMSWGFFLYVSWYNPSQGFVYYAYLQQWPLLLFLQGILGGFLQGAALAGLLLFVIRAPTDRIDPNWRWLERAVPLLAILLGGVLAASYLNNFGYRTEWLTRVGILAGFAVDITAIGIMLSRRKTLKPEDNQRLRWVMWGCLIGLPAFIFAEIAQGTTLLETPWGDFTPNDVAIGLLYLANGVFCLFVFEAVRRPRVVNVTIPLRRVTILGLSLSIPALLLHEAASNMQETLELPDWSWIGIGAVVAYLISRMHEFSVEKAERFFNRHLDHIEEKLMRSIAEADNLADVERHLAEGPFHHLKLTSAAAFRHNGDHFERHAEGRGWDANTAKRLDADVAFLAPVVTHRRLADLHEHAGEGLDLPKGVKRPIVGVPATMRGRLLALALYGPHHSGADLDANERAMLARLADTAAEAYAEIENAALRKQINALEQQIGSADER